MKRLALAFGTAAVIGIVRVGLASTDLVVGGGLRMVARSREPSAVEQWLQAPLPAKQDLVQSGGRR